MSRFLNKPITLGLISLILTIIAVSGRYQIRILKGDIAVLQDTNISDSSSISELTDQLASTTKSLAYATKANDELADQLEAEQRKNGDFEKQVRRITRTVDSLEKLSQTDKELLQKYSKIYFLNENYSPSELSNIPTKYTYVGVNKTIQIHSKVLPFLSEMFEDAKTDGVDISVISAYRSFGTQATLKAGYKVTYGTSAANQFSADQGYSEHQLGTTLDFTTTSVGSSFSAFEKTPAYTWLIANAYKYGFVISYPSQNAYYQFEPWHWRFVGTALAKRLNRDDVHFYDLDQRDIDVYLGKIFD